VLDELNTPDKIQDYIDTQITYNSTREDRSVSEVIHDHLAECFNGALFAVACLLKAGYEASVLQLNARAGDEEHVLCIYKQNGYYGAIAQSKFLGLKSRQPIYRSIRDLANSYVEFYFSFDGRYTLQSYTDLLPLKKYSLRWLTDGAVVAQMAADLAQFKKHNLVELDDPYYSVNPHRYWTEILMIPPGTVIPERYLKAKPV
jgi:hypothetical protein